MANAASSAPASTREHEPSRRSHHENSVIAASPGPATNVMAGFVTSGRMRAETPRMTAMLNVQLP